jgi:hypothetical protein
MAMQKVHTITDQPARRPRVVNSSAETTGSTRTPRIQRKASGIPGNSQRNRNVNIRNYSPTRVADKSTSGVGLLEAEFLTAIILLILMMFANTSDSYSNKIMSVMKRGTLTCLLFFILAMVASIGPNAAKFSKAFGALVVVGILVTSPTTQVLSDLDNIIKNDWVGTSETEGGTSASSSDTGTGSSTSSAASDNATRIKDAISGAYTNLAPWLLHVPANALPTIDQMAKGILSKLGL